MMMTLLLLMLLIAGHQSPVTHYIHLSINHISTLHRRYLRPPDIHEINASSEIIS